MSFPQPFSASASTSIFAPLEISEGQRALVQGSLVRVVTLIDEIGADTFARLFETAPHLRELFPRDLAGPQRAFLKVMTFSVHTLERPEEFRRPLEELGRRHAEFLLSERDYEKMRDALLWAMRRHLGGDSWTAEAEEAWGRVFDLASGVMREAAAPMQRLYEQISGLAVQVATLRHENDLLKRRLSAAASAPVPSPSPSGVRP